MISTLKINNIFNGCTNHPPLAARHCRGDFVASNVTTLSFLNNISVSYSIFKSDKVVTFEATKSPRHCRAAKGGWLVQPLNNF